MEKNSYINPISLSEVSISDPFWKNYMELIRKNVIPYQWEALNDRIEGAAPSYCIHNFSVASGKTEGTFGGCVFQDSDLYKWLEAASYSLMWHPDKDLEEKIDSVVNLMEDTQQDDGYLDTYYIINGLENRFTNLRDNHELYCLGHMLEAAVAYYQATGKEKLLTIASRYADCVANIFGSEPEKLHGYPGHEVAELALVKLYHVTGKEAYLKLAEYFINERGQEPNYFSLEEAAHGREKGWGYTHGYSYYQADKPVREQTEAMGHAVRAVYLYSGMADVARETNDPSLITACETLWNDIVNRKMYITGAIGSSQHGEAFTFAYDLPNDTIYGETCAAIGLVFFARRMFELTHDSKYIDVMERAIYNGIISGMSLDGTSFFYVNPLEVDPVACKRDFHKSHVKPQRQKWFGCACCPPNVARLLSSIASYAYETDEDTLYINLFMGGDIHTTLNGHMAVSLEVATHYPWEETGYRHCQGSAVRSVVRWPSVCPHGVEASFRKWLPLSISPDNTISVPLTRQVPFGPRLNCHMEKGYLYLTKEWNTEDVVELCFLHAGGTYSGQSQGKGGCRQMRRHARSSCILSGRNGQRSGLYRIYLGSQPDFHVTYQGSLGRRVYHRGKGPLSSVSQTGSNLIYTRRIRPLP